MEGLSEEPWCLQIFLFVCLFFCIFEGLIAWPVKLQGNGIYFFLNKPHKALFACFPHFTVLYKGKHNKEVL